MLEVGKLVSSVFCLNRFLDQHDAEKRRQPVVIQQTNEDVERIGALKRLRAACSSIVEIYGLTPIMPSGKVEVEIDTGNLPALDLEILNMLEWGLSRLITTPGKAAAVEDQDGDKHPWGDNDPDTPFPHAKIADRLSIPKADTRKREALRKRLEAWRKQFPTGGWVEAADRKGRQPKYLYPIGKVWHVIENMKPSGNPPD